MIVQVANAIVEGVKERAIGAEVIKGVTAEQQFVKLMYVLNPAHSWPLQRIGALVGSFHKVSLTPLHLLLHPSELSSEE